MRSFGTTIDNLIDEELDYGASNYELIWYQNEKLVEVSTSKLRFHFGGPKMPIGNVIKDYIEIETDYMEFYKGDAIRLELKKGDASISVGPFYVDKFEKKKKATYVAYSSLLDLSKIKLSKYESSQSFAYIKDMVAYYLAPLGITFDSNCPMINMAYIIDQWETFSIYDLIECVALADACNFTLQGNVLKRADVHGSIAKVYQSEKVVYTNGKCKHEEDAYLDCIKMNYRAYSYSEDDMNCEDAVYDVAPYGTQDNAIELSFKFIPYANSMDIVTQFYDNLITEDKVLLNDYEVPFLGDPRIEVGDVVSFESEDGTTCTFRVGELIWEWDGGLKCIASTGSTTTIQSSAGGFTSVQQMADALVSMSNSLMTVRYNAVYTNQLYAKVAEFGFASVGELSAEVAKMGLMTAEQADIKYMTVSSADMRYATIDLSNIENGTITNAMIATGAIGTAQIADGSITDAKIVGLTANKITAGTLDAGTIEVVNLNAANITVGTINGHQIASGAISLDNLASDVTNKLADTEAEVAQAVADAKQAILSSESATSVANTADSNASTALSTANTAKTTANAAKKNTYASFDGKGKSNGYFKVATLKITNSYVNRDIVIGAVSRGYGYTTVQIMFGSVDGKDPSLTYLKQNGRGAWYIYKSATSTWEIYCKKNEAYGSCQIVEYVSCSNITLTWNGSDASADLPSGATRATQLAGQASWCYDNNLAYINGGKLYTGTVVADAIAAGAIVSDKIASSAVTAVKIAAGAIETDKLAANAVTAAKIASGTITATQIASSTITGAKIASSTITSTNIASSAITTDKLVASAVTAAKISSGAITTEKLAANAVTAAKIASGTITATQIAASTITAAKLNVTSLSAISANLGTVTAGVIKSTNYAANSTGMKLDLSTGVWDSKNTKIAKDGAITCSDINITGGDISLIATSYDNAKITVSHTSSGATAYDGTRKTTISPYSVRVEDEALGIRSFMNSDGMVHVGNDSNFVKLYAPAQAVAQVKVGSPSYYVYIASGDVGTSDGISLRGINTQLANRYSDSGGLFQTARPLLINGNALNSAAGHLVVEYNGSYFYIRNDGSSTYFMNGNASGWTNYAGVDINGNWTFNGGQTMTNTGIFTAKQVRASAQASATCSSTVNCYISTSGQIQKTSSTSSARYKDDVTAELCDELNPHRLYDINVIQFKYKKDYFTNTEDVRYRKNLIGFIAEDIYEKYKIAADYYIDEYTGETLVEGWNPQYMIPAMLKLIQEQHNRIIQLEKEILK